MINFRNHLIKSSTSIREALQQLDILASDAILFVIDSEGRLKGSLTDGDVRRGLLKGVSIDKTVSEVVKDNPKFIRKEAIDIRQIIQFRSENFKIIPVVDSDLKVLSIVNFNYVRSYLPIDAIIMAGGKGMRLKPLTENKPKPLLMVGEKTIMEHNVDRLSLYGIVDFWFSVKYLGNQIVDYFGDGKDKNRSIEYVWEDEPLGTIGSASKIDNLRHEHILVSNSDILTNLDYEAFYLDFLEKDADCAVLTIPYNVSIPYAVLETSNGYVLDFKEKPTYTYYSNGGIYLMKRSVLNYIPKDTFFNATDLMEKLISENKKVISFPLSGYWLDVGNHKDFNQAQLDIKNIKF